MDADERDICIYLKSWACQFVSGREISRRAGGKRRFREDPNWANAPIARLVERNYLESDTTGHYRLRRREHHARPQGKWVSPEFRRILQRSSKDFSQIVELEEPEEYYADAELNASTGGTSAGTSAVTTGAGKSFPV